MWRSCTEVQGAPVAAKTLHYYTITVHMHHCQLLQETRAVIYQPNFAKMNQSVQASLCPTFFSFFPSNYSYCCSEIRYKRSSYSPSIIHSQHLKVKSVERTRAYLFHPWQDTCANLRTTKVDLCKIWMIYDSDVYVQ